MTIWKPTAAGATVRLLPEEEDGWVYAPSTVAGATFYKGAPPVEALQARIAAIVSENAWLAGRLITDDKLKKIVLWVPEEPDASPCFSSKENPNVVQGMPYEDIVKHIGVGSAVLETGPVLFDQDMPLFNVSCVKGGGGCFCLVMSISHGIADGATFYKIYNMLDLTLPIHKLNPERVFTFAEDVKDVLGREFHNWTRTGSKEQDPTVNFRTQTYSLDLEWVEQQKVEQKTPDVEFVSTNDLLTSLLFRLCDLDSGSMFVNFRERVCGVTEFHAGNYEDGLMIFKGEFESAVAIRKLVKNMHRDASACRGGDWKPKSGCVSTWATFHHDVQLEGCDLLAFTPVYNPAHLCNNLFIVYRPKKGMLFVLACADEATHTAISAHPAMTVVTAIVPS